MWLDHLPASVAFCDVETTGLGNHDRIVSFGGIGMISRDLAKGRPDLAYLYLVFDPGTGNRGGAERIHGFSDSALRLQDPFAAHAAEVWHFLTSYELLVAHNAAFDLRFINREMRLSGLPALTRPVYCTMKGYRALDLGGSASLSAVTSSSLVLAICTTRSRTPGSRCRSTFGCTAVRVRVDCAACSLARRPTSVTLRSVIVSIDKGRTIPACPSSQASKLLPCCCTRLAFVTMAGRRAAQTLHPARGRSRRC
jgi:hypothetical protein